MFSTIPNNSVNFLGLDVICDWWGGEYRTSRFPFWWSAVPVAGVLSGWDGYHNAVMSNGYSYCDVSGDLKIYQATASSAYQTRAENTQYLSM